MYKYDSMGNLRYQKDSVGNVKEYEYDLFSRITAEKTYGTDDDNANETEVRYLYDLYGNVKYKIDANNTVTKYEYDELGRLTRNVVDNVKLIDPATGVDSTTRTSTHETLNYYDKNGNVLHEVTKVTEKDKSKNTTKSSYSVYSYEYDGMGRLVSKIDPVGNIIEKINYNRNSAQIESYDGEDHKKTFEYNKDGKLSVTKQRNESGEYIVSQQYYDARGNVAYVIDGRENITVYNYDEQDNLTGVSSYAKVKEGVYKLTDTTRYIYDKNGNMKSQEINGIVTNTFNYNVRNLVMEKEYPGTSNNIVSYYYYADGNVKEVIDRKNIKTQYKYNPQGLVVEEKAVQIGVNGTEQRFTKKNYEYDSAGNQLKSILTSSTSTEVVERTYDELGRVKTKGVSNVEGKILYIYDIVTSDGLTAETSIDQKNNITTKVYDKAGRLAFVKNGDINAENIAEYDYYKNGAAKSVIYAGGAREDYIYYPDGRLESLVNTDNKGVAFESYVYTYDANGNMLSKEDKKGITTYTYDNLNRLKTVDEKYSGKVTEYTYDKLGNRSTATIKENGIIIEEVYNYNLELNQLKSVITKKNGVAISTTNYEYDANGNLTSSVTDGEKTTYAYDEFNQLINADGAKYGYNAEGYRVSKNVNGSLTRYIYEYDKVVLEIDAAGNQVGRNIYGTNLLMRTADGQSYYYMYNGHADVTALINAATGNIDATYYYDAFGNIVESTGVAKDRNSILYAGYQYDKETGLYYLNARMYDPKIARFLQEDTYTGDPKDPLSLNLYTYCANNPLIYYDPTGHVYVPLEVPIEYVNKHYKSVKEYELKLRRQAFIAEIWPTYKEDLAKSRLELRQKGWILPAAKEEEEYINYIFYERSKAKRDRMLKGMLDEAKANFMDLVAIGDSLIGQKIGVNLHIGELVIRKHTPQLVNESSYIEELMSPFINSGTTKQLNFIERDLYDAEMQGRLGFLGLMTISEMAIEEAVAWQKIKKANKVLSSVDDTKQFWDDFADFLGLNKGNSKPSIWDKNWKPAVEPNLQLFAEKPVVNNKNINEIKVKQSQVKDLLNGIDIEVGSIKEADALLKEALPNAVKVKGAGPNKPDFTAFKGKNINGMYHKDYLVDPKTGRIYGHDINNPHGDFKHINIKLPNGSKVTIKITPKGKGGGK